MSLFTQMFPPSVLRDFERVCHDAEHPVGMSVHDERPRLHASTVRLMLQVMREQDRRVAELEALAERYRLASLAGDARIAELEARWAIAEPLLRDIMAGHQNPDYVSYNECEDDPCQWCVDAQRALDARGGK